LHGKKKNVFIFIMGMFSNVNVDSTNWRVMIDADVTTDAKMAHVTSILTTVVAIV
jgi:hypothetical protein